MIMIDIVIAGAIWTTAIWTTAIWTKVIALTCKCIADVYSALLGSLKPAEGVYEAGLRL